MKAPLEKLKPLTPTQCNFRTQAQSRATLILPASRRSLGPLPSVRIPRDGTGGPTHWKGKVFAKNYRVCYNMKDKVNQQERLEDTHRTFQEIFSENEKYFLGGFFEGEGSLYASLKINGSSRFGYYVDPEFAVYQHQSGLHLLEKSKLLFGTGSIYKKPGSETVWQHVIVNRRSLMERVIPFYEKYVFPFSCKQDSFLIFKELVHCLEKKEHLTKEGFITIVKMAYTMNPASKGKQRKVSLEDMIAILESSETTRLTI